MGTLTKKIQRHPPGPPASARMRPPTTGARCGGDSDRGAEEAEGPPPLRVAEQLLDERRVLRGKCPGGDALCEAGRDEHADGLRGSCRGAAHHEAGQRREEHRPPPHGVAEPAGRHQREAERQRVSRHHPLDRGGRRPESLTHRGQRDGHDADVEQAHEAGGERDREGPPAPRIGGVLVRVGARLPLLRRAQHALRPVRAPCTGLTHVIIDVRLPTRPEPHAVTGSMSRSGRLTRPVRPLSRRFP